MEPKSCPICCDSYNRSTRLCVECPYCHFETCRSCIRQYILSTNANLEIHCMNDKCKTVFNYEQIGALCGRSFMSSDYNKHVEKCVVAREQDRLIAAQNIIGYKREIEEKREERRVFEVRIDDINNEIGALEDRIVGREPRMRVMRRGSAPIEKEPQPKKPKVMCKCPAPECRGLVQCCPGKTFLGVAYGECGVCTTKLCCRCHETLVIVVPSSSSSSSSSSSPGVESPSPGLGPGAEHACNEDLVKTVEEIASKTKQCPKCSTDIYKIDGCNQMFCTHCKTGFDWKTLEIIKHHLHNPHFFEWMRQSGAEAPRPIENDAGPRCYLANYSIQNRLRDHRYLVLDKYLGKKKTKRAHLINLMDIIAFKFQAVMHVHDVFGGKTVRDFEYIKLAMKYLKKKSTESAWIRSVRILDKKREKKAVVQTVLDMYDTSMHDVFVNLLHQLDAMTLPNDNLEAALSDTLYFAWKIDALAKSRLFEIEAAFGASLTSIDTSVSSWPITHPDLGETTDALLKEFPVRDLGKALEEVGLEETTVPKPLKKKLGKLPKVIL